MSGMRTPAARLFACLLLALASCSPGRSAPHGRSDGGGTTPGDDGGTGTGPDGSRPTGPQPGCGRERYDALACEDPALRAMLGRLDSDMDGLTDEDELCVHFTDPCNADSDGDGQTDLAETAAGTDPSDRSSRIDETRDFFVVLPYGEGANRPLRFGTAIQQADVFFLVDMTGSMGEERTNLIRGLVDTIIPGVQASVPNVEFGVAGFDDYPYGGFGSATAGVVGPGADQPFYLLREIAPGMEDRGQWSTTASATTCPAVNSDSRDAIGRILGTPNGRPDLLEAVEGLPCHYGGDYPESYVPALFATATGMGLAWPGGSVPGRTCPTFPDEVAPRRGYPCFRAGSLPIVLLFGDAPFHNGPGGVSYSFPAPQWGETLGALNGIGARVMGIYSGGGDALGDFQAVARQTGAVRSDGTTPLVFTIAANGSGLSTAVVDAVRDLVGGTPQDVGTTTENVAGNPDDFDARRFIRAIVPVEGYGPDGIPGPRPGISYTSIDAAAGVFRSVIPGTIVEFRVEFYNDVRPAGERAEVFQARIIVLGNGVARLDERRVFIVVPPDGSVILI